MNDAELTEPESTTQWATPKSVPSTRAPNSAIDQTVTDTYAQHVDGGSASPGTNHRPTPRCAASPENHPISGNGQCSNGTYTTHVVAAPNVDPPGATRPSTPRSTTPLVDRTLAVMAELLNDLEELRKANANRLKVMTRVGADKDGKNRGWELPEDNPAVVAISEMVDTLTRVEARAQRELEKMLKNSPLGPWVAAQHGLGLKTIARLLAAIGDPYIRPEMTYEIDGETVVEPERPRMVSELVSYVGCRPGQRRQKGERTNWNPTARMRLHNIVEPVKKTLREPCHAFYEDKVTKQTVRKTGGVQPGPYLYGVHIEGECSCSPYRVLWDQARDKYADGTHAEPCVRCAPKGHPAAAGSPLSAAHQAAMADRLVKIAVVKDLWREAKRLHEISDD